MRFPNIDSIADQRERTSKKFANNWQNYLLHPQSHWVPRKAGNPSLTLSLCWQYEGAGPSLRGLSPKCVGPRSMQPGAGPILKPDVTMSKVCNMFSFCCVLFCINLFLVAMAALAGNAVALLVIILNVACTTSIITINKKLYISYHFGFGPTLLLTLHQITCTVFAFVSVQCRAPDVEPPPRKVRALIILSGALSNVFVNLSLKFNTVGTYQLLKMLNVPITCVGEFIFFKTRYNLGSVLQAVISGWRVVEGC